MEKLLRCLVEAVGIGRIVERVGDEGAEVAELVKDGVSGSPAGTESKSGSLLT